MIKTIKKNEETEITVKKSTFIANIFRVDSEEEAKEKIKNICKKYFDAKHNCYAYRILKQEEDRTTEITKFSDNKEPQGTAGGKILEVIKNSQLYNVIIVVTRYFGGILLGTGGLSRAYSESAQKVVQKAEVLEQTIGNEYIIKCGYEDQNEILYELKKQSIKIKNTEYKEKIEITISISKENIELLNKIEELKYKTKDKIEIIQSKQNEIMDI